MWSRFKPVVHDIDFIDLFEEGKEYYKGKYLDCGITIPTYTNVESFKTALKEGTALWSYTPPRGKNYGEPMRLGDFRRYYSDAINPIGDYSDKYFAIRATEGHDSIEINIELTVDKDDYYNLTLWDLVAGSSQIPIEDMYLGVYLIKNATGIYYSEYFKTFDTPIGTNSSFTMTLPINYDESGEFEAYLFLSSLQ